MPLYGWRGRSRTCSTTPSRSRVPSAIARMVSLRSEQTTLALLMLSAIVGVQVAMAVYASGRRPEQEPMAAAGTCPAGYAGGGCLRRGRPPGRALGGVWSRNAVVVACLAAGYRLGTVRELTLLGCLVFAGAVTELVVARRRPGLRYRAAFGWRAAATH